ncbi:MAG: cobalamin biosynthesis protein [Gemmatimonadota bacterium]|nr:cobalamin biosynthesis protein [Gemmatimonadota bacterium]
MKGVTLLTACTLDALVGEPRRAHPVRGMGGGLMLARAWNGRTALGPSGRLLAGTAVVAGGASVSWWLGRVLAGKPPSALPDRSRPASRSRGVRTLAEVRAAAALSLVVSLRELLAAARRVRTALECYDLDGARSTLARDLVSRDTTTLTEGEIVGATVESLAENLNDAFVAPLFWAVAAGPGAAYAYRFINTADAVLGYRTPELEHFGRAAAWSDDVLGWVPARLTAAALAGAAPAVGGSSVGALRAVRRCAGATPSPNGGWPMAAAAGALDVRLEKRDAYVLHPQGKAPSAAHLRAAERLVLVAGGVVVAALGGTLAWLGRHA